jgi:hypothetical protein
MHYLSRLREHHFTQTLLKIYSSMLSTVFIVVYTQSRRENLYNKLN